MYRGEIVPDGRGHRGGYVFLQATLDQFVKRRMERLGGPRGSGDEMLGVAPAPRRRERAQTLAESRAATEVALAKIRAMVKAANGR